MGSAANCSLFFVNRDGLFPEGTLLELENQLITEASLDPTSDQPFKTVPEDQFKVFGYRLQDRGDGIPGFMEKDTVIPCPPFSENVPPGRCPVRVTYQRVLSDTDPSFEDSPNNIGIFGISVDENLHWQRLKIPLSNNFPEIERVTLTNTLKHYVVDEYESPSLEQIDGGRAFCLHVGHVGPGFYEMNMRFGRGRFLRARFIKYFPPEFNERYTSVISASQPTTFPRPSESMPVNLYHSHTDDFYFSAEVMNHALDLATEWGENFRKPIHERMKLRYPDLSDTEIDRLKAIADEAESYICRLAELEVAGEISEYDIIPMARKKFPWVSQHQLNRIKNIGMYWARK